MTDIVDRPLQVVTPQPAKPQRQQQPSAPPERTPIPIAKLLFTAANPHGVKLPDGWTGANERIVPNVVAGDSGEVRTEISHLPWMRVFRVTKSRRVTRTEKGKEVTTWDPMGKPFHIPDSWAVSVPAGE